MRLWGVAVLLASSVASAQSDDEPEAEPTAGLSDFTGDISQVPIEDLLKLPIVESASRRKQALDEAPATLSAIRGGEVIEAGPFSLAESLRRVPGVHVMQVNANLFSIGMRGVNRIGNKNVIVLFNGRRLSELSVGSPTWTAFPAHVAEIERIEVLRGPGTTLYGADALNGVISIRTERPLDHPGSEAFFGAGTALLPNRPADFQRQRLTSVANGYAGETWVNAARSLGTRVGVGFTHHPDWTDGTDFSLRRYGDFGYHAAVSLEWRPDPATNVFFDARHVMAEGNNAVDNLTSEPIFLSTSEQSATLSFEKPLRPEITAKGSADFRRILMSTNVALPGLARLEFQPENVTGHGIVQLDVRSFDRDRNVLSVAGEITSQRTFNWFGQSLSQVYVATVIQDELRVTDDPRVLVSAAVRLEQVTSEGGPGEHVVYRNVNARLSLVARLSTEHSLRLTAATAYRTPSPFENFLELSTFDYYPGEDVPPVPTLVPNPSLEPERAESIELGYRGRLSEWLRTDTVVYAQRLERPIALSRPALPFQYQHNPDQDHLGLELGLTAKASSNALAHLSYTLTRAVEHDSGTRTEQFPTHILSVGGSARFPDLQVGADFQYISSTQPTLLLPQQDGLVLRRYTVAGQPILSLRAFRPLLGGSAQLFVYAMNVLAAFRDRADLMQHPNANVDPVGATFLVGVRL